MGTEPAIAAIRGPSWAWRLPTQIALFTNINADVRIQHNLPFLKESTVWRKEPRRDEVRMPGRDGFGPALIEANAGN